MHFEMPLVGEFLATAEAASNSPTAVARIKKFFKVDDVFISRRSTGEPGRWVKSGWQNLFMDSVLRTWEIPAYEREIDRAFGGSGDLRLWQTPADAFIRQLAEAEELAILVTDNYGQSISAIFDVRYLSAALDSADVGWQC